MEKTLITSGKTIEAAVEAACAQLGLSRDDISYQVVSLPKAGFLGIGNQPAKVEVTYEAPDPQPEAPKVALSSASRSKPKAKPAAPKAEEPKAAPVKEAPKAEKKPERKAEPKVEEVKAPKEPKVFAPAEPGSIEERIEVFLKGLLEHMGSDAVPHALKG